MFTCRVQVASPSKKKRESRYWRNSKKFVCMSCLLAIPLFLTEQWHIISRLDNLQSLTKRGEGNKVPDDSYSTSTFHCRIPRTLISTRVGLPSEWHCGTGLPTLISSDLLGNCPAVLCFQAWAIGWCGSRQHGRVWVCPTILRMIKIILTWNVPVGRSSNFVGCSEVDSNWSG